jgi:hypothetical protein
MGKELQRYQWRTEKGCSLEREREREYGAGESDANANGVAIDSRQEKNRQKQ